MLFRVDRDPHQFQNVAADLEYSAELTKARSLLDQWKDETGDSVPDRDRRQIAAICMKPLNETLNAANCPARLGRPRKRWPRVQFGFET